MGRGRYTKNLLVKLTCNAGERHVDSTIKQATTGVLDKVIPMKLAWDMHEYAEIEMVHYDDIIS